MKTLPILRASLGLEPDEFATFRDACWERIWGAKGPKNLGASDEITAMCEEIGFDAERILAMGKDEALKGQTRRKYRRSHKSRHVRRPDLFCG